MPNSPTRTGRLERTLHAILAAARADDDQAWAARRQPIILAIVAALTDTEHAPDGYAAETPSAPAPEFQVRAHDFGRGRELTVPADDLDEARSIQSNMSLEHPSPSVWRRSGGGWEEIAHDTEE